MKQKIRADYQWDGDDAILADKVSDWIKTYLLPCYKFLNIGCMDFSTKPKYLSSFIKKMMGGNIPLSSEYWDLDRVICPMIQMEYVMIRCNLTNDIWASNKGK